MSDPAIEADELSRRFALRTVLDRIAFTVPTGSVTALVGPNGAGKSTTIRILLRLLRPSAGRARVLGVDAGRLGPRQLAAIGYLAADQELPGFLRGHQLLSFLRPFYPSWDDAFAADLVARFAVPLDRVIDRMSRGERARLALVAAIAYRPRLLVLDEPFGGLDPAARDDLTAGILEAAGDGGWTVFVASHDLDRVERMADRVIFLDRGRVLLDEATDAVLGRFRRLRFTALDDAAPAVMEPMASWIGSERMGRVLEAIDSRHDLQAAPPAGWTLNTSQPLTLREIFVALARRSAS